jgi:hypothetical protein
MNRFGLALVSLSLALAPAGGSFAQGGFGADSADPGTSLFDYKRCYALDVWRLNQAQNRTPPAEEPEQRAIQQEAQNLAAGAVVASHGRSADSVASELRSFTTTQMALYQRESADGAVSRHAQQDEAFCRRNGLIDDHGRH